MWVRTARLGATRSIHASAWSRWAWVGCGSRPSAATIHVSTPSSAGERGLVEGDDVGGIGDSAETQAERGDVAVGLRERPYFEIAEGERAIDLMWLEDRGVWRSRLAEGIAETVLERRPACRRRHTPAWCAGRVGRAPEARRCRGSDRRGSGCRSPHRSLKCGGRGTAGEGSGEVSTRTRVRSVSTRIEARVRRLRGSPGSPRSPIIADARHPARGAAAENGYAHGGGAWALAKRR